MSKKQYNRFAKALLELSISNNFEKALDEWDYTSRIEMECSCICQCEKLKTAYFWKHKQTGKEIIVGSQCRHHLPEGHRIRFQMKQTKKCRDCGEDFIKAKEGKQHNYCDECRIKRMHKKCEDCGESYLPDKPSYKMCWKCYENQQIRREIRRDGYTVLENGKHKGKLFFDIYEKDKGYIKYLQSLGTNKRREYCLLVSYMRMRDEYL